MTTSWSDRAPSLVRILRADLGEMLAPLQPTLVYIYGSTVTGLAHPDSDVDFGIDLVAPDDGQRRNALLWARQRSWPSRRRSCRVRRTSRQPGC